MKSAEVTEFADLSGAVSRGTHNDDRKTFVCTQQGAKCKRHFGVEKVESNNVYRQNYAMSKGNSCTLRIVNQINCGRETTSKVRNTDTSACYRKNTD